MALWAQLPICLGNLRLPALKDLAVSSSFYQFCNPSRLSYVGNSSLHSVVAAILHNKLSPVALHYLLLGYFDLKRISVLSSIFPAIVL